MIETMFCTIEQKDWAYYFSAIGPTLAAFTATGIAYFQYCVLYQQKQISLYENRYHKIYKVILDSINKIDPMMNGDIYDAKGYQEIAENYCREIDYARFLVKKSDFEKINSLYNEIIRIIHQRYTTECNKKGKEKLDLHLEFAKKIEAKKKELLDIIIPYLQIETEGSLKRFLHAVICVCGIIFVFISLLCIASPFLVQIFNT